jgi:fibronectin-binding autotransporter adhesin
LRNISCNNTYAGAVTLSRASRINAGSGTLTLSGGVSGNFAKTFGGAVDITVTTTGISGS